MRRIKSFQAEVDDDVASVNLVFDTTIIKDIQDAINELEKAKKQLEWTRKPLFTCERDGCNNTFRRRSSGRPQKYCTDSHRVRAFQLRKAQEIMAL